MSNSTKCQCRIGKKYPIPPYPVVLAIIQAIPIFLFDLDRFITKSTSESKLYPIYDKWYIPLYFLFSFSWIGLIQSIHSVLHYVFCFLPFYKGKKALIPGIVFHVIFSIAAILNIALEVYDMESAREYQGRVTFDLLDAYVFHTSKRFAEIRYNLTNGPEIKTTGGVDGGFSSTMAAIIGSPGHWSYLIIVLLSLIALCIAMIVIYANSIKMSLIPMTTSRLNNMFLGDSDSVSIDVIDKCVDEEGKIIKVDSNNNNSNNSNSSSRNAIQVSRLENNGSSNLSTENHDFISSVSFSEQIGETDGGSNKSTTSSCGSIELDGKPKRKFSSALKKCTRDMYRKYPGNPIINRSKETSVKSLSIAYWTYPMNIVLLSFALIAIITMPICLTAPEYSSIVSATPISYSLLKDFFVDYNTISTEEFNDVSSEIREQLQPYLDLENRRYLDTRANPYFPLMHGDLEDFCRINSSESECVDGNQLENAKTRYLPNSTKHYKPEEIFSEKKTNKKEEDGKEDPLLVNGDDTEFDIVMLIVESFSPSSAFVDDDIEQIFQSDPNNLIYKFENADDPNRQGPTGYYNKDVLPNLHELSGSGSFVVFPGVSSMSLPTINGWFSLVTQTSSWGSSGTIDGMYLHTGDIFTVTKSMGFETLYLAPSPLGFDGKDGVMYKLSAEHEAIAKELLKIKKNKKQYKALIDNNWSFTPEQWEDTERIYEKIKGDSLYNNIRPLDTVVYSFPYKELMEDVEGYLEDRHSLSEADVDYHVPSTKSSWVCDRITSLEFLYYFQHFEEGDLRCEIDRVLMAKRGETEGPRSYPIFATYANVGTHTPFLGFDDNNKAEGYSESTPLDKRYSRALHMMDRYQIGRTIDFLKKRERDSVVVIVGDHGARTTDLGTNTNTHCRAFDLGGEQFYTTSAMIGYIKGTREGERRNMFLDKYGDLLGTIYNGPADHTDLTATLISIASMDVDRDGSRLYIPPNPSTGRNLFEVMRSYENEGELHRNNFFSYSMVALEKEIRYENEGIGYVLRGHANSHKDHIVLKTGGEGANGALIYPSCRDEGGELSEDLEDEVSYILDTFERRRNFVQYIIGHDRIFHPEFITSDALPEMFPPTTQTTAPYYYLGLIAGMWILILVVIYSIMGCVLAGRYHLCGKVKK